MCALVSISPVRLPIVSAINYGLAQGTYKYHISTICPLATERDTKVLYSITLPQLRFSTSSRTFYSRSHIPAKKGTQNSVIRNQLYKNKAGGGGNLNSHVKLFKMLLSIYSETCSLIMQKAIIPSPKSLSVTGPPHDSFPTDLPSSKVHSPK